MQNQIIDDIQKSVAILEQIMKPFGDISDENLLFDWQREARELIRKYNNDH